MYYTNAKIGKPLIYLPPASLDGNGDFIPRTYHIEMRGMNCDNHIEVREQIKEYMFNSTKDEGYYLTINYDNKLYRIILSDKINPFKDTHQFVITRTIKP